MGSPRLLASCGEGLWWAAGEGENGGPGPYVGAGGSSMCYPGVSGMLGQNWGRDIQFFHYTRHGQASEPLRSGFWLWPCSRKESWQN